MRKRILLSQLTILCFAFCMPRFGDMSGKWSGFIKNSDKDSTLMSYIFKVNGKKLTGTAYGPENNFTITNGTVKDSLFSFTLTDEKPVQFTGKYYGDLIDLTIDPQGKNIHFVLKRAKE
jgi:hypothetical protein